MSSLTSLLTSTCYHCGQQSEGGIHTNGDPYGDRRRINLPVSDWRFYCWDCSEQANAFTSEQKRETDTEFSRLGLCGFLEAWIGRCRNPKPCNKHTQKCYRCDSPAIANCSIAGSLVCGVPYCAEHPHEDQPH